jgi:nicotinamidase-related amidase
MFSNEIHKSLQNKNINNIILTGVETQWCVSQTAQDLLVNDYKVHIPIDAVSSQNKLENKIAIQRLIKFGAYPCTTHGIICELLQDCNSFEAKWYLEYLKNSKMDF